MNQVKNLKFGIRTLKTSQDFGAASILSVMTREVHTLICFQFAEIWEIWTLSFHNSRCRIVRLQKTGFHNKSSDRNLIGFEYSRTS